MLLLAIGVAGSQAGHLIAYQARFGGAALRLERTGAHAYFLPTATGFLGALGAATLAAVFLVGWTRILAGRRLGFHTRSGWRALDVLPLLFALQLAIYAGQESIENLAVGGTPPAPADLLLWGALGQLPLAAAGAVALAWISTRLEGAFAAVDARLAVFQPVFTGVLTPRPVVAPRSAAAALAQSAPAALVKRGPPPAS